MTERERANERVSERKKSGKLSTRLAVNQQSYDKLFVKQTDKTFWSASHLRWLFLSVSLSFCESTQFRSFRWCVRRQRCLWPHLDVTLIYLHFLSTIYLLAKQNINIHSIMLFEKFATFIYFFFGCYALIYDFHAFRCRKTPFACSFFIDDFVQEFTRCDVSKQNK